MTNTELATIVRALSERVTSLENELADVPQVQARRHRVALEAAIEADHELIAMTDRDERNRRLLARPDLQILLTSLSAADAVKICLAAPDEDICEQWIGFLRPSVADVVRVELVEPPQMLALIGNPGIGLTWEPSEIEVSHAQRDALEAAGLDDLVTYARGYARKYPRLSPPKFHPNMFRVVFSRGQLELLKQVWPALGPRIEAGDIVITEFTADENREWLLDEWGRTPLDQRKPLPPRVRA